MYIVLIALTWVIKLNVIIYHVFIFVSFTKVHLQSVHEYTQKHFTCALSHGAASSLKYK